MTELLYRKLTEKIIGAFFDVHNQLGPGRTELAYANALVGALGSIGLSVVREVPIQVRFGNEVVGKGFIDLVVEGKVAVEIKAVAGQLTDAHEAQLRSYLRSTDLEVGLLVNFGARSCEFRRVYETH